MEIAINHQARNVSGYGNNASRYSTWLYISLTRSESPATCDHKSSLCNYNKFAETSKFFFVSLTENLLPTKYLYIHNKNKFIGAIFSLEGCMLYNALMWVGSHTLEECISRPLTHGVPCALDPGSTLSECVK